MKNRVMKPLAIALCAILLVVAAVATTVAYLTDTAEVKNTFTVGNVTITLDEAKVTAYGVKDGEDRVAENTYKLIPGHTYVKDPTIHVGADSESCYIFFEIKNELGEAVTFDINDENWIKIDNTNVYYYKEVATAGNSYAAFTKFTVGEEADLSGLADKEINVIAYAVQKDGFDTAAEAWADAFTE